MSDFWKSYDITAAEYGAGYECYPLFGTVHLIELALSALFLLGMVWWYRRSTPRTRRHILVGVTAALLADALVRLIPGALTDETSALSDSFQDNLLSPPVYTRPAEFNGWKVPDVLLSGNPKLIRQWQDEQALERTRRLRPELINKEF